MFIVIIWRAYLMKSYLKLKFKFSNQITVVCCTCKVNTELILYEYKFNMGVTRYIIWISSFQDKLIQKRLEIS